MKNLIYLLGSISLMVLLQIYIMGGYDNQTIDSKLYAIVFGVFFGGFILGFNEIGKD